MQKFFHKILKAVNNQYILLLFLYLFVIGIQILHIGFFIRNGYEITSTLDFSWNSDTVARFLHGYIAGKDFIFTYGPLFQFLKSIPSILFSLPAYGSILLSPLVFQTLLFLMTYYLVYLLTPNKQDRLGLFLFLFFVVGLSAHLIHEQIVRIFPILLFSLLYYRYVFQQKRNHIPQMLFISFLPSFFGLYTYDLFIQCVLLSGIYLIIALYFYKTKSSKPIYEVLSLIFILVFHLLISFVLTGNLLYIQASLDTVSNYFSIMNIPWAYGTSNIFFIFPLLLPLLFIATSKGKTLSPLQKKMLFVLMITALIQLRTTLIRSDEGHIIMGIYPSIIVCFILLFYLLKEKFSFYVIVFALLFVLIPFKASYDQILSPKNAFYTIQFIRNPSSFLSIFSLPKSHAFTKEEIQRFIPLMEKHPGEIFIYPYDSYVLNVVNQTFNSYALQLYDYSDSLTEEKTIEAFTKQPPKYIIMGLDGKAALALDDMPNFTRNPLVAAFLLQNYQVEQQTTRYLILRFNPKKKEGKTANTCSLKKITFTPISNNMFYEVFGRFIKSPVYYIQTETKRIRIPYKPTTSQYLVFDSLDSHALTQLFSEKINWERPIENTQQAQNIAVIKQFPFLKKGTSYTAKEANLKVYCLN